MRQLVSPLFVPVQAAYGWLGAWLDGPLPAGVSEERIALSGLTLHRFVPSHLRARAPRLLFLHGGGWLVGGPRGHAGLMAHLALATGGEVVSVDYRLAPQTPIVAALADCWRAARYAQSGLPARPLVVVGESAGAMMAALIARRMARWGLPLAGQVLVCPITDIARTDGLIGESGDMMQSIVGASVAMLRPLWLRSGRRGTARLLSPLAQPVLPGTAPALIVTAAQDPLAADGSAYAAHLSAAGVPVTEKRVGGAFHGYWSVGRFSRGSQGTTERIARWIADLNESV
jgi:acetyl esterase